MNYSNFRPNKRKKAIRTKATYVAHPDMNNPDMKYFIRYFDPAYLMPDPVNENRIRHEADNELFATLTKGATVNYVPDTKKLTIEKGKVLGFVFSADRYTGTKAVIETARGLVVIDEEDAVDYLIGNPPKVKLKEKIAVAQYGSAAKLTATVVKLPYLSRDYAVRWVMDVKLAGDKRIYVIEWNGKAWEVQDGFYSSL